MPSVDFSNYSKQDVDVPYYVGKGKNRFTFSRVLSEDKLQFRRYEIYPFGIKDFISGLFLSAGGDLIIQLPAPTKKHVTLDFVSYSGGSDEGLKVRGFNSAGEYIGYCILPHNVQASVRRSSLELPEVKFVYVDQPREYTLVSITVDQEAKRKLSDIRVISDYAPYLTPQGRLAVTGRKKATAG